MASAGNSGGSKCPRCERPVLEGQAVFDTATETLHVGCREPRPIGKCERCGKPSYLRFCSAPCILNAQAEHAPELQAQVELRDADIAKLRAALKGLAERVHDAAMGLSAVRLLANSPSIAPVLRASLTAKCKTNDEVEVILADAFEYAVMALGADNIETGRVE